MAGKRGAPYGNVNAWKHGRYSHSKSLEEIEALGLNEDDLRKEIILQREVIRQLSEYSGEEPTKERLIEVVRIISKVMGHLQRLIMLLKQIERARGSGEEKFRAALDEETKKISQDDE